MAMNRLINAMNDRKCQELTENALNKQRNNMTQPETYINNKFTLLINRSHFNILRHESYCRYSAAHIFLASQTASQLPDCQGYDRARHGDFVSVLEARFVLSGE